MVEQTALRCQFWKNGMAGQPMNRVECLSSLELLQARTWTVSAYLQLHREPHVRGNLTQACQA